MLRSERSAWSNITGMEPLPSKEDMPSPAHYSWADDDTEWHLDTTGPWTDDALEIGKNIYIYISFCIKSHAFSFIVVNVFFSIFSFMCNYKFY